MKSRSSSRHPSQTMSKAEFGSYTKRLRIKAGLSQCDVARIFKFKTGQLVSNWERGLCMYPLNLLRAISQLYDVDLKVFFDNYAVTLKAEKWKRITKSEKSRKSDSLEL